MTAPAKSGLGRKILKIAGIVGMCIVGLLLIGTLLLLTVLEPYAERYLKKQVSEATDGRYQLAFDDIDINLLSTTLRLHQLHLHPDTSVYQRQLEAGDAPAMLLEIKSPELEVGRLNLLDMLFRNRLTIRSLLLESPEITILQEKGSTQQTDTAAQQQASPLPAFLDAVLIDDLHIPNATIRHFTQGEQLLPQHIVPQLTFRILELELKELDQSDPNRMFAADDVQLSFSDYTYQTPDSVYSGHIGHFSYSSREGELVIDNILIKGDDTANLARGPDEATPLVMDFSAPRLRISGLHLLEAFHSKELLMEEIRLEGAALDVLEDPAIPANAAEGPELAQLWEALSDWVQVLSVEEFRLEKASLAVRSKQQGEIVPVHALRQLDLALHSIRIDSATLFTPRDSFPLNEYLLTAQGYSYQHPLSPYLVDIAKLELSSRDRFLQIDSLQVLGDWEKNERLKQVEDQAHFLLYTIETPQLRISELDLISAYQQRQLDIGRIAFAHPSLDLLYDKSIPPPDLDSLSNRIYAAVSDYIKEVEVAEIDLQNLFFTEHYKKDGAVTQVQRLDKGSLQLRGLALDSAFVFQAEPMLPLQEITLAADGYNLRTPDSVQTFRLERLRYSSQEQVLSARTIAISSNQGANARQNKQGEAQPNLIDLSARRFRITGLDIIRSLNSGRLEVDQVVLSQPEVALLQDRDVRPTAPEQDGEAAMEGVFSLFTPISAKTIRLEEGAFIFREKRDEVIRTQQLNQLSATITGLHLSPDVLSGLDQQAPLQEIRFSASDYTYRSPDSLYTLRLDSLQYSSLQQQLTARTFSLAYDQEVHEQRKAESLEEASRNLFDIEANKLLIRGFDVVQAYNTGRYTIEEVLLTEPQVSILQDQNVVRRQDAAAEKGEEQEDEADGEEPGEEEPAAGKTAQQDSTTQENLEQLAEFVETFRIARLRVEEGTFEFRILEDTIQRSQQIEHVSVAIDQLRLVSLESADPLEMFAVDELGLLIRDYAMLTADSLYEFRIGEVRSSLGSRTLTIDSLNLVPLFMIEEYPDKLEYSADRIELKIESIDLAGFDLEALYNEQHLLAGRVQVNSPDADFYRDNRLERDPTHFPPTLQKMLRNVPLLVAIDTLLVEDGTIVYSEVSPTGVEPGVLTLDHTRLEFFNITNDSLLILENNIAAVTGESMLMGESKLSVEFAFHLNHPKDRYTYEGSLEPMPFQAFNPLFEKLMHVKLEKGGINKAVFVVDANADIALGEMRFLYNDLRLQLLDKEDPENPGFKQNATSWLINTLVIKSNNPGTFGHFRPGDIEAERDYQKSAFNHMSSAMISGMTSSLMPSFIEKLIGLFADLP